MRSRLSPIILAAVVGGATCGLQAQFFLQEQLQRSAAEAEAVQEQAPAPTRSEDELARLRLASSQYEIIQVLIDEGEYERIPSEFDTILGLGLKPGDQELVVQAAWNIVESLRGERRYAVAHRLVERTLEWVEPPELQFSLLMLQGKLYQDQRLFKKALQSLERARSLQNLASRPQN